jgi:type IV pilus assembly protein PilQ
MAKKFFAFTLILSFVLLTACAKKRPDMSYHQKNRGVVQDINMVSIPASAKNFEKNSKKFAKESALLLTKNNSVNPNPRRVSLSASSNSLNTIAGVLDFNSEIKNLETTPVTLKFNTINIRSALRLFAGIVKRNIIIGNEVNGDITLDFENIRWGSAVYAILEMNNLVMIHDPASKMLRVHTKLEYLMFEKQKVDQTNEIQQNLASLGDISQSSSSSTKSLGKTDKPIITEIFKVFNQSSEDAAKSLLEMISDDGDKKIGVISDNPSNQLVIKGTAKQLDQAEVFLDKIDVGKKSVMVEAFIINAEDGFAKVFDANLSSLYAGVARTEGGNVTTATANSALDASNVGSLTGLENTINQIDTLAPSAATLGSGMLLLGNIGSTQLRAAINASVTDTNSESLSNPKLFAIDGEKASIVQGLSLVKIIPASGDAAATTTEVNLNLNLTVTPQIIGEKIKLDLSIANNSLGSGASGSDTPINNESITSKVILNNGDVAVIGGVYKNTKTDSITFTPLLHYIPIIGNFFKDKSKGDTKSQLLIFITANIV